MKRLFSLLAVVALVAVVAMPFSSVAAQRNSLLSNIAVTGTNGFTGTLNITELALNEAGQLVASGTLTGTTTIDGVTTTVTQTFNDVVASLIGGGNGQCEILQLDLGPIFLDLLGLQVDLSAIDLDITAVSGAGNLLGNLLCAVAGLLDGGGPLQAIGALLDRINNLL
jgi:hypothetical protein